MSVTTKPILAATAVVTFGYVAIMTQEVYIRRIAVMTILNAFFCHVFGNEFIKWDLFCNTIVIVFALCTCAVIEKQKLSSIITTTTLLWVLNHYVLDSAIIHAIFVQGMGALALCTWKL
jgi:hypothetical protein